MERYFDDFNVGDRMDAGSYTISLDEIKAFAARYDPQPFHLDEAAAARSPFKRLVASRWHTRGDRHEAGRRERRDEGHRHPRRRR